MGAAIAAEPIFSALRGSERKKTMRIPIMEVFVRKEMVDAITHRSTARYVKHEQVGESSASEAPRRFVRGNEKDAISRHMRFTPKSTLVCNDLR